MRSQVRALAASEPAGMAVETSAAGGVIEDVPTGAFADSGGHGLMKKKFRLFNTITSNKVSANMRATIRRQTNNVAPENIRYQVSPQELPRQFDPRTPDGIPQDQVPYWFFTDENGKKVEVISIPLDQAGCGSCWAFAAASMFSDQIRIALMKRYGGDACVSSQFFEPITVCTGESNVQEPTGGVVNAGQSGVYAMQVCDRISEYWTSAFSPKMREVCPAVGFESCIHHECSNAIEIWRRASKGRVLDDVHKALGNKFQTCMGCEGNHIAMPLILFTDPNLGAASLLSEFPLSDWVCLFGSPELQKIYCIPDMIQRGKIAEMPKLFNADKYSYVTSEDLRMGYKPANINSMEDWIKATVFNYGPVVIGYAVYQSFMDFFRRDPKGIYRFEDFAADIGKNPNIKELGGHAVVVVGWGEVQDGGKLLKYWVARNSWGRGWGDGGYFRFERNMDAKLAAAGFRQRVAFEQEFGLVFFAPAPNRQVYAGGVQDNPMKKYLLEEKRPKCTAMHTEKDLKALHAKCVCPRGHVMIGDECVEDKNGMLEAKLLRGGTPMFIKAATAWPLWKLIDVIVFILLVVMAALVGVKRWKARKRVAPLPVTPGMATV